MGRALMFIIGLIYLSASVAFMFERRWLWGLVALCWGIGNIALAFIAAPRD